MIIMKDYDNNEGYDNIQEYNNNEENYDNNEENYDNNEGYDSQEKERYDSPIWKKGSLYAGERNS